MDLPDLPVSDVTPLGDRLHCVVVDYIPRGLCEFALGEELWCGKVVWESGVGTGREEWMEWMWCVCERGRKEGMHKESRG